MYSSDAATDEAISLINRLSTVTPVVIPVNQLALTLTDKHRAIIA